MGPPIEREVTHFRGVCKRNLSIADRSKRGRGVAVPQIFHYGHNRKAVCGACYATKYDSLERVGVLAEGECHDCRSSATLLIQLEEIST